MAFPPLPEPIGSSDESPFHNGCWLIIYKPTSSPSLAYDGTLRVNGTTISGDLYYRRNEQFAAMGPDPDPSNGIPIQARDHYRKYLRVTDIQMHDSGFSLTMEMWEIANQLWVRTNRWVNQGLTTATLEWKTHPWYPSEYAEGTLDDGQFTMGWISDYYRKASVEIDTAPGCKAPLGSGEHSWTSVFDAVGWDVTVHADESDVTSENVVDGQWSDANMHEAMLAHRQIVDLDTEWHYHILSVNIILSTPRGIMYDSGATDSDNVPREGVGIANDWIIPQTPEWGSEQSKKFADSDPLFFRTAVHELGHAFGLYHDTATLGFMNTTDVIAAKRTRANPFPGNIVWEYASQGLRGLRHFPDPYVRPGGQPFGKASFTNPTVDAALDLKVTPLESEVPIGAPVRIQIELTNTGIEIASVPTDISLRSENVSGEVKRVDGSVRTFRPLIRCVDETPKLQELKPGDSTTAFLTLLRGGEGALFHSSGLFDIAVNVHWEVNGLVASVTGLTSVYILPVENAEHAHVAHKMLTTPDAQLVLVMGQSKKGHIKEGVDAIKEATEDGVLGRHYASIEARRLLQLGDEERVARALKILDRKIVSSKSERDKLDKLIKQCKLVHQS